MSPSSLYMSDCLESRVYTSTTCTPTNQPEVERKGCDSNFEVNFFQILKVTTNETTTLYKTICTKIVLAHYNNNDQQFNRNDFLS